MRTFLVALAGGAALSLASCGGGDKTAKVDPDSPTAFYDALRAETYVQSGATALDVDAAIARLPEGFSASYGSASFDNKSGATVISDFRFGGTDAEGLAVEIDTLRLWGADFQALFDRFDGARLDETVTIFERLDAEGVKLVGLETLMETATDAYVGTIADTVADLDLPEEEQAEFDAAFDFTFDNYDFSMGRTIIDGLVLQPWAVTPVEDEEEDMTFLRMLVAGANSVHYDAWAAYDMTASFEMTQFDLTSSMDMTIETYGARDVRGFDYDEIISTGIRSTGTSPFPDFTKLNEAYAGDEPPMVLVSNDMDIDLYRIADFKLADLADHLTRWEMPDLAARDLFSLGIYEMKGLTYDIAERSAVRVGSMVVDAREFVGILPANLLIDVDEMSYSLDSLVDFVALIGQSEDVDIPFDLSRIGPILQKYDASTLTYDVALEWIASPETGVAALTYNSDQTGWGGTQVSLDLILPDFETIAPTLVVNEEGFEEGGFEKIFEKHYRFVGLEYAVTDVGGLDKWAGLAIDLAKLGAEVDDSFKFITGYTPETLRQFLAASMAFGMSSAPPEMRGIGLEEALAGFSEYLKDGGEFVVRFAPDQPLGINDVDEDMFDEDPAAALQLLGFSSEHTPPN